jgi:hypothetical protein
VNIPPEPVIKREPRDTFMKRTGEIVIIWDWWYCQETNTIPFKKLGYELQNCNTGNCQTISFDDFEKIINEGKLKFQSRCERR